MRRLFEALASDGRQRHFLVWAGAGDGSFLGAARALGARQALYVEPHPGLRARLLSRHALADNEVVSPHPLWRAAGPATLHVTNDAASSSLVPPGGARPVRPNIRVVETRPVEADTLDTALARLDLQAGDGCGLLVLDTRGAEAEILAGASAEALGRMDTIVVPAQDRDQVQARLSEAGFSCADRLHDEHGGVWAVFVADAAVEAPGAAALREQLEAREKEAETLREALDQAEAAAGELRATVLQAQEESSGLRARLEQIEGETAGLRTRLERGEAEAADLRASLDQARSAGAAQAEAVSKLEAQLSERTRELEASAARVATLAGERDAAQAALDQRTAELDAARAQLAAAAGQSSEALEAMAADRDAQAARAADLQQQLSSYDQQAQQTIAALTRERDAANAGLAEKSAAVEQHAATAAQAQAHAAALDQRIGALEQQLVESRQVAALSVKLQAQRDADLADLQERYRESQSVQARQRELLEKLGARLNVASHYFHQLADLRGQAGHAGDAAGDAPLQAEFDGDQR